MSVSQISQLRKKSNKFVNDLESHIAKVVNFNEKLEQLNKDQLQASKLANDQQISQPYDPGYSAWKSKNFPQSYGSGNVNLFLSGDLYKSMDIKAKGLEYQITVDVPYALNLAKKYGDFLGIAPSNHEKAQTITVPELRNLYIKHVLA